VVLVCKNKNTPDYNFQNLKTEISDSSQLKKRIIDYYQCFDMDAMAKDVELFLFQSSDTKKMIHLEKFID